MRLRGLSSFGKLYLGVIGIAQEGDDFGVGFGRGRSLTSTPASARRAKVSSTLSNRKVRGRRPDVPSGTSKRFPHRRPSVVFYRGHRYALDPQMGSSKDIYSKGGNRRRGRVVQSPERNHSRRRNNCARDTAHSRRVRRLVHRRRFPACMPCCGTWSIACRLPVVEPLWRSAERLCRYRNICPHEAENFRRRPRLFQATLAAAEELGLEFINATIRADNVGGLAYYTRMGFEPYDRLLQVPLLDGTPVDRIKKRFKVDAKRRPSFSV